MYSSKISTNTNTSSGSIVTAQQVFIFSFIVLKTSNAASLVIPISDDIPYYKKSTYYYLKNTQITFKIPESTNNNK